MMRRIREWALLLCVSLGFPLASIAQAWQSSLVYPNADGHLAYVSDSLGNHVPNWASAGYHNGNRPLPFVPNVDTISPIPGDNRLHIQSAINAMATLPLDANGHRGALLFTAGTYEFSGTLELDIDGVVLRGVGDGADPNSNTILYSTDTAQIDAMVVGNGAIWDRWRDSIPGTRRNIMNEVLAMGSSWLELSDTAGYYLGAPVVVVHPATNAWLASVNYGDTGMDPPWTTPFMELLYRRKVIDISGNHIRLDAPIPHPLRRNLSTSYVYIHDSTQVRREIGIENLRMDCVYDSLTDEAHAWNMLCLYEVENSWVRDVTVLHFSRGGIVIGTGTNVTVQDCESLDPISIVTGSRRYNFDAENATNNILFQRCYATEGRHSYVSNGANYSSGIVFTASTAVGDYTSAEGHRKWSHALLFDSLVFLQPNTTSSNPIFDRVLGLYNRGDYGTAHGWASAHSVLWNCTGEDAYFVVEKPPSAQNYAFGCRITNGSVLGSGPFGQSPGWIEGEGQTPAIGSLYRAQRAQLDQYGSPPDPAADLKARDTTAGIFLE
ncbi:MAG: peptidoglycan-binding protein, partial [Bacteroidota bacterium]